MNDRQYRASLSKGRAGWCVDFRHPLLATAEGRGRVRLRRGLGTRDENQARQLVAELNELLSDKSFWNAAARDRARSRFAPQVVAAFFDQVTGRERDGWSEREKIIPLPTRQEGFPTVLLVGTTGAGKTTLVRQLIGTDPLKERFPSTSAAKTTICDLEIIADGEDFEAVVSFLPRDIVRHYVSECITAAVAAHLEGCSETEIARRFMEHSEMRFRLSYLLGSLKPPKATEQSDDDDLLDDDESFPPDDSEISDDERTSNSEVLRGFMTQIESLAVASKEALNDAARDLSIDLDRASPQERDTLQELVEESLQQRDDFHALVDAIMEKVESRFEFITSGELEAQDDGWPTAWMFQANDRQQFLSEVNRFSSNYAPSFGRLLTPLVEGIRVRGPFAPGCDGTSSSGFVLLDGQGIGHSADSNSSISTSITKRFPLADIVLLVDNAAQPMQAAPVSVLRTIVASGHESKLIIAFTHFDEIRGPNLPTVTSRKDHVISSFFNAVQAVGKSTGREAEHALRRLIPERLVFLAKTQAVFADAPKLTQHELSRLVNAIESSIEPPPPIEYRPVYDVANLVLAVQKATQEFHDLWKAILGMGSRANGDPAHWAKVKALTRRIGLFGQDEYSNLQPIANLIFRLQNQISAFLSEPLDWLPEAPPESESDSKLQSIDAIRKLVHAELHGLSHRRVIDEHLVEWIHAFGLSGVGSTRVRARELTEIYDTAAPIPNEMPSRDANAFLYDVRKIVADSVIKCGGELRGWTREDQVINA